MLREPMLLVWHQLRKWSAIAQGASRETLSDRDFAVVDNINGYGDVDSRSQVIAS